MARLSAAPRSNAHLSLALISVALVALAGCRSSGARWRPSWDASGARFTAAAKSRFSAARADLDAGRTHAALASLRTLKGEDPDNLEVGAWVQDIEFLLLENGVDLFAPAFTLGEDGPASNVLRKVYGAHAGELFTVTSFVLAARAETDVIAAETLLERALELDPTSAWAHYGLSHVLLEDRTRSDRWSACRASLDRALNFDPGHVRARRLEAWMAAQEGASDTAESLLRRWIKATKDDPRVTRAEAVDARLDLARLLLLRGEDARALRILEDLEGEPRSRPVRLMLLTVARQEVGDIRGALRAVLAAQGATRDSVLPLVQEALLLELFLGETAQAEERWGAIADLTTETSNIADLIQGLRARVRLERAQAEQAAAIAAEGADNDTP